MQDLQLPLLLRQIPSEKASVPIVAVTANAFGEDCEAALKAGMNKHLAKPYDIPQIIQTLYSLIYTAEQQE